jgi:CRISPR-associated protein Cmr3
LIRGENVSQADAPTDNDKADVKPDSAVPVLLAPRDPIVFRDGRSFDRDPGARAFSLDFPLPRTVAGAIRSHVIGTGSRRSGEPGDWADKSTSERARALTVEGPLLVARHPGCDRWEPHVPAPADVVPFRRQPGAALEFMILRPVPEDSLPVGAGTNLPAQETRPVRMKPAAMQNVGLRPMAVNQDVKPERDTPAFWTLRAAERWLLANASTTENVKDHLPLPQEVPDQQGEIERLAGIAALPKETRTHVGMDETTGTARDGMLFSTDALAFLDEPQGGKPSAPALAILCNLPNGAPETFPHTGPSMLTLGGERRMTRIEFDNRHACWPQLSPKTLDSIVWTGKTRLRLQFVTPALFVHGWLPAWMADGVPPGLKGHKLHLELVGCAMGRQVPVSGWRMSKIARGRFASPPGDSDDESGGLPQGPRKLEYAVPAGSVYFFEVRSGNLNRDIWKALWLKPVSDQSRDRAEGFGLVLPGFW